MNRRAVLKGTVGVAVGGATIGEDASVSASGDGQFPQVSTRGHFGVNWLLQTELQDGYGPREFDTNGEIPGYHTDEEPDELVLFIHRWLQSPEEVDERAPGQAAALEQAGFDGPVVNYAWDADTTSLGWWVGVEFAKRNGKKVANFLTEYAHRSPGTKLRVIGYSLGAWMLASAAQSLAAWDDAPTLDAATFIGGAVPHDAVSMEGQYGSALDASTEQIDNFWKSDDRILSVNFRVAELTQALGSSGISGTPPSNYTDHRVDYVASHGDYWKVDTGCAEAIVDA